MFLLFPWPSDPSMPSVCRLQSLFLSHNYMVSKLQEQEVNGCTFSERFSNPEVHVIKLWSAGSGLCGYAEHIEHTVPVFLTYSVILRFYPELVAVSGSAALMLHNVATAGPFSNLNPACSRRCHIMVDPVLWPQLCNSAGIWKEQRILLGSNVCGTKKNNLI